MGHASFRRGAQAIRRSLEREQRAVEFRLLEDLNALPKYPDAGLPLRPLRIDYDAAHDIWWFADAVAGPAGFAYWYSSLREGLRRWQIALTGYDATTGTYSAIPRTTVP